MTKYEEYRSHPYISQSDLKNQGSSSTPSTKRGNLVDCLITTPEEFDSTYKITKASPSDTIATLLENIYQHWDQKEEDLLLYKELILQEVNKINYGNGTYSWNTIVKRLDLVYWEDLIKSSGKILVPEVEYLAGVRMAEIVKKHPYTKDFFKREVKFQHAIFNDDFEGLGVKGLVDVKIEEDTRTYIDIKTIYNHDFWWKNFKEYRYDIQLPFYEDIDTDDRPLGQLIYIFVDPIHDYPLVYEMEDPIIHQGRYGKDKYIIGYVNDDINMPVYKRLRSPVKGYYELIEEYKRRLLLDIPSEHELTKGRVSFFDDDL